MVTGRVPFAFGIGFAAVCAGCGARTVGWGMSCCCPSQKSSTEPFLCFALTATFSSGRYRYRPEEKSRGVLGVVWDGSGGRTFGWYMSCCYPSRRRSTESLLCLCTNGDLFLVDGNDTVYKRNRAESLEGYRYRPFRWNDMNSNVFRVVLSSAREHHWSYTYTRALGDPSKCTCWHSILVCLVFVCI